MQPFFVCVPVFSEYNADPAAGRRKHWKSRPNRHSAMRLGSRAIEFEKEKDSPMTNLTGKQLRYLRGLGHHLHPVVMIGKGEIGENVVASVEEALTSHELIKVKLQEGCEMDRREAAEILAGQTGAIVAQILGKTILLYREGDPKKIELP
jgi:RNA-binding protein